MEWIILPRQGGKTTRAVKLAAERYAYIVAADAQRVEHIASVAKKAGLDIPFPITFAEFMSGRFHRRGIKASIIEDVDELLCRMAGGVPVMAATATGE